MIFLALLLTLHMYLPQCPLAYTDTQDLRRDLLELLRPAKAGIGEECLHVALLKQDRHQTVVRITLVEDRQLSGLTTLMNRLAAASLLLLCNRRCGCIRSEVGRHQHLGRHGGKGEGFAHPLHHRNTFVDRYTRRARCHGCFTFPRTSPAVFPIRGAWYRHRGSQLGCSVDEMVQESRCVIADYHLRTVEVQLSGRSHLGYLGSITYEYLRLCISPLHALARLAFFTGSGYGTDHGMGVTRVVIPGRA